MLPEKLHTFNAVKNDIFKIENITIELNDSIGVVFTRLYSELYPEPMPESSSKEKAMERIFEFLQVYDVENTTIEPEELLVLYANTDPELDALTIIYSGTSEKDFLQKSNPVTSGDTAATYMAAWIEGEWDIFVRNKQ